MNPQELNKSINSGELPPVLCLCGDETYHRDRALRQIIDRLVAPESRDFNLTVFHGKDVTGRQVLEESLTLPVFAARRVVLVKDAHLLGSAETDALLDYLQAPCPETVLVFCADKVDKRKRFFQQLGKSGHLVEFKPLYDNQIPGFVKELLQEKRLRMSEKGMELFCRRVGSNLQEIAAELEKLAVYVGNRDLIDDEDVAQVVCDVRADSVFALTDALGQGKLSAALTLLNRLLNDGEAPLGLLSMIVRHFRQLWKIRELLERGAARREIFSAVGINPYFVDGLIAQAQRIPADRYGCYFELFLETDLALKSSGAHASALLENLLVKIVSSGRG